MSELRVAVISDVHGNRWALEAVLADVRRRGIREIVNLGDCVYGPLDPCGTAALLMDIPVPTVRGNEDRAIEEGSDDPVARASIEHVRKSLTPAQRRWLAALPHTLMVHGGLRLFHGTPRRDDEYLLQDVGVQGAVPRSVESILARLAGIHEPVVLCGHDHTPRSKRLPDGRLIVDPGSVGLQAYTDDLPFPHAMQTGSPHARYAILTRTADGFGAEHIEVSYPWQEAAAAAVRVGRTDWARRLETGRSDSSSGRSGCERPARDGASPAWCGRRNADVRRDDKGVRRL